jgi:hypothetical protein
MAPLQRLDLAILALDDPGTDVHLVHDGAAAHHPGMSVGCVPTE